MQITKGHQSPAIEAKGNVTVNYYLTKEQYKKDLEEEISETIKQLMKAGLLVDPVRYRELEQKHQILQAKLADIEKSYEEELARRKEADAALEQMRGQLPEVQIEQAQVNLRQGKKEDAKQAFHKAKEKAKWAAALAAYQLGQMAEGEVDYAEAMRQYKEAVMLVPDNYKYLLAAGSMAWILADYQHAEE